VRVGWLADKHDPPGGAELTQAEFRRCAPENVEIIDCLPGETVAGLEAYVLHNHTTYSPDDLSLLRGTRTVRYYHDVRDYGLPAHESICCSPIQAERMGFDQVHHVPPPIDLQAFRPTRQQRRHSERSGACCVGAFMNPGKAGYRVAVWADENEPVDVFGFGAYLPQGPNINYCGPIERGQLPTVLSGYERFVFLPTSIEPFGRCVVEAWAAGCEIVTNNLVGARYWLEERPEALETAAEDFWNLVTTGKAK